VSFTAPAAFSAVSSTAPEASSAFPFTDPAASSAVSFAAWASCSVAVGTSPAFSLTPGFTFSAPVSSFFPHPMRPNATTRVNAKIQIVSLRFIVLFSLFEVNAISHGGYPT
jgi:hypothetical protein